MIGRFICEVCRRELIEGKSVNATDAHQTEEVKTLKCIIKKKTKNEQSVKIKFFGREGSGSDIKWNSIECLPEVSRGLI